MAVPGGAFKDVLLAIAIVGGVLGGLFLFTGVWPPMVVVESGSMMHGITCPPPAGQPELCDRQVGYGKFGTIDPGDMVFVQKVTKRSDVTPMAEAAAQRPGERNYGKPGDVIVYFNFENVGKDPALREQAKKSRTPIIHRAIAFVEVNGVPDRDACFRTNTVPNSATFTVFWDGQERAFGNDGIFLPEMGFGAPQYPSIEQGWKPCWSGFITKGDNPVTNRAPDQALGGGTLPRMPVEVDWVEGKAIGELPWFGLIKLALSGSPNYSCARDGFPIHQQNDPACENGKAPRVLNAYAPADLWVMLGVSLAVIAIAPLGYDMYLLQQQKKKQELLARGETPPPTFGDTLRLKIDEVLSRLRSSPTPPPPDTPGGVDPRRAFEPSGGAVPPPPPPPPAPPSGGTKPASKFERVKK